MIVEPSSDQLAEPLSKPGLSSVVEILPVPDCVTVNVCRAMVSVPVRALELVLAVME